MWELFDPVPDSWTSLAEIVDAWIISGSWPAAVAPDRPTVRERAPNVPSCGPGRRSLRPAAIVPACGASGSAQSGDGQAESWAADASRRPRIALKSRWHARRQSSARWDWFSYVWRSFDALKGNVRLFVMQWYHKCPFSPCRFKHLHASGVGFKAERSVRVTRPGGGGNKGELNSQTFTGK